MIYRLRYCNKDGVEARVDIQKGLATPVIEVEGTERPFVLSYNNDKGNKSGMFLSSSADIEIYETTDFNINNLKTSNETELSVTHYINNVISWQGFIIPDFFSIEVRNNPVITMTASDRLGTLKNVTLSDLPSMISLRELAVLCLNKTGLSLPLRTMADFNNGTGINDFFNSKILTQRLSDTKGRSISCYDILSSILTASNSFLVQRSGGWHIINKIQHEAGSGKLYTGATSFINWSDVIFNFSDISTGGRRTIIPVASTVGVFHEFGGSKTYPSNYDFKDGASGWTVNFPDEMEARFDNRNILGFDILVAGGGYQPVYGTETNNPHMVVYGFRGALNYVKSEDIVVPTGYGTDVEIKFDINASAPIWNFGSFQRMAVFAVKDTATKVLASGSFVPLNEVTESQYMNRINFEQGTVYVGELARVATESFGVSGKLSDAEGLDGYTIHIRLYSSDRAYATVINFATINFAPVGEMAKGNLYKTERTDNYTKDHDIDTSLFADYIATGLNGYFYRYAIDDTSSLYNSANELTSKWTAYNDTEQLPLLQHITRQKSRLFSVAHDLLSAEIEVTDFDPLAIFVACEKRYTVVSAQFDFFKSNLSVELEEVAFQSATVRDFIYSYFGDGESGIKSIGGISGGTGGGGSIGGGLTPEQIEILSFWKKDPDNPNTIFTEMNAYSKLELSAYGAGDGGGSGGSDYERLDTWADYDSSKAGWVLSALLGNELNTRVGNLNTRVGNLEGGSALTVNTTGTGNAITSISKSGTVITANKGLTFALSSHTHTIAQITGLQTALGNKEPAFSKNTAFNKNFGTTAGTVAQGNDSRIINGQTAFGWGNHALQGYASVKALGSIRVPPNQSGWYKVAKLSRGAINIKISTIGGSWVPDTYSIDFFKDWSSGTNLQLRQHSSTNYFSKARITSDGSIGYLELYANSGSVGVEGNIYSNSLQGYNTNTEIFTGDLELSSETIVLEQEMSFQKKGLSLLGNILASSFLGNASTATKLQTPRTIAGVSFDGTANIAIPFANLSSKPTTLGGYGITDAYTKTEADTALALKLNKSVFDDLFEKVEVSTGVFAIKAKYNFYGVGEVSAYGIGSGGGGGGGIIETVYGYSNLGQTFNNNVLTDTFNAYTINQINTRLVSVESGSALTVNTTGTGNAITSISKAGSVITANKGLTFSLSGHTHTISDITNLQTTLNSKLETSIFNTHNTDNVRHITGAERAKWDGVVTDFAGLEIGGRNLLSNLPANWEQGYWNPNSAGAGVSSSSHIRTKGYYSVKSNNQYCIFPTDDTAYGVTVLFYNGATYLTFMQAAPGGLKFTTPSNCTQVKFYCYKVPLATIIPSEIVNIKIKFEDGNKPTTYSPAPEDQVSDWNTTDVNSFSFIKNKPTLLSQFTDNIGVATHIANKTNPHAVTTAQIGAVDRTSNQTIGGVKSFTEGLVLHKNTQDFNALLIKTNSSIGDVTSKIQFTNYCDTARIVAIARPTSTWAGILRLQTKKNTAVDEWNEGITIDRVGNVGIGTTNPQYKLDVSGTGRFTGNVTAPKVIFNSAGWSMEQVGNELQMKHNNVLKMRFTNTGSIVATEEITAFG